MSDLIITKEIQSPDGLRVVVRPATYLMGMQRTILTEQAKQGKQGEPGEGDLAALAAAVTTALIYPALVAATIEHEGFEHWPPTPTEMMDLPEVFVAEWETATFALNPQWVFHPPEDPAQKKAVSG